VTVRPIEFDIRRTGEDYLVLINTIFYLQTEITKQDGNNLDANDPVSPVNLLLHSMFSQVDISLNRTQVTTSTNTYPYRAMLEKLLSYDGTLKVAVVLPRPSRSHGQRRFRRKWQFGIENSQNVHDHKQPRRRDHTLAPCKGDDES